MNDKNNINKNYEESEWNEPDIDGADRDIKDAAVESQEKPAARAVRSADDAGFSDVKEYPETPFRYYEEGQVNVQLSSGNFHYEVTDFVLPGRNGFDISIVRRFDSGCANLEDMAPYVSSKKLYTGARDNDHYTSTYGLGYGWSMGLPSIEAVPYMYYSSWGSSTGFDYILHLEDGRSLSISRNEDYFDNYSLKDVSIITETGAITHPFVTDQSKGYDIIIGYKNGNRDYFKNAGGSSGSRTPATKQNFKLVARQDKFKNTIFYDLKGGNGMTIVDTWGRTLSLSRTDQGFAWKLPGAVNEQNYGISYKVDRTGYLQLKEVTNQAGYTTKYEYYNPDNYNMEMRYASMRAVGNDPGTKSRKYLLLSTVEYPNGVKKVFEYENTIDKTALYSKTGRKIANCHLLVKKDVVDGNVYNQVNYSYTRGTDTDCDSQTEKEITWISHIEIAKVMRAKGITEIHTFSSEGQLLVKEIKKDNIPISHSSYGYYTIFDPLVRSADDTEYSSANPELKLVKKTSWEYSKEADVTKVTETYPEDPGNDQEVETTYGAFSTAIQTTRKKGSDKITEKIILSETMKYRAAERREVYVNDVLKEKTEYQYKDSKNPYSVTCEKQHVFASGEYPGQTGGTVDTFYTYSSLQSGSSQYTHNFIIRERTGIKDADGLSCPSIKEEFTYDNWGRLISRKDPRNQIRTTSYDSLGRVTEEVFPSVDGQRITNRSYYNDTLNYITQTDANGLKKRIQYTPFGQVQRVWLALTDKSQTDGILLQDFRYNSWRELEKVISYDGNGTADSNIRKTESSTYDSLGRVLTRTIPQVGYKETYQYHEVFVDPRDGKKYHREVKTIIGETSDLNIVTECYKDQKGQIRKEFLAGKVISAYKYDNAGNQIQKTDAQGKADQWEYDYANRVVKAIRADSGQKRVSTISYDALGNKRFSIDENGKKTEFQYDGAGRLIQIIAPFDNSSSRKVKYYYDAAGNVIREKKAENSGWQETGYVYDAGGRVSDIYKYLSSDNWIRTTYRYDVMGNVVQMRTGDTPAGDGWLVTGYTYNQMGKLLTTTDSHGGTESFEYDKVGRQLRKTDRNGNRIDYQYDALERQIKETVSSKGSEGTIRSERESAYSKTGKLIWEARRETKDGEQSVSLETRYEYDNKGQLVRQRDPGNVVKEYTYHIHGKRESFRLFSNGKASPDINLYYLYDDNYRLKQVRKGGAAGPVQAEYDYDIKGNRKAMRYPQSGIETGYEYNDAGCIVSLDNKRAGTVIAAWKYGYDVNGNVLSKTNMASSSPSAISYRYDRLGRLTEEDYPGWKRVFYTYDAYSNREKMMVGGRTKDEPVSVTNYWYDQVNRLEKEVRKQGKTTETYRYYYDNAGNQILRLWEKTSPTPDYPGNMKLAGAWKRKNPTIYEQRHYNGFNQLVKINQDDEVITYQYRGDGLRHSSEVKKLTEGQGKTKRLYWDGSNIAAEQTDQGSVKCYLRGNNLIAGEKDGVVYYYILNEHGDVVQLRGGDGTCKASYEYDAFGIERHPKEGDENPFRYCGEYLDPETNTYYLRARSYNSETGRFQAEDSVHGITKKLPNDMEVPEPSSLNRYTYAHNNPNYYQDPSGHFVITTGAIVIGGMALLGAVLGGIAGNYIAEQLEVAQKDKWRYVVAGAATGAALGVIGGTYAAPAIAASTGIGGISVTSAGITTVPLITVGAERFEQVRQLVAANQVIESTTNKYAFGLTHLVEDFAANVGATHFMNHTHWRPEVYKAFTDPIGEIYFLLDGIDDTLMSMINTPGRSGINFELNMLYDMKEVFERTMFYYYGEIYIGFEVFSKVKPL